MYPRTLALYLALLATVIVGYRISPFHPLAKHPGPFLCKVTAFWMAYLSLEGEQHRYIRSLHERYGDVVRIGALYASSYLRPSFLIRPSGHIQVQTCSPSASLLPRQDSSAYPAPPKAHVRPLPPSLSPSPDLP